jgi:hypothetical protein
VAGVQNNGGPTQTIALLSTSPVVDAIRVIPISYCTAIDSVTPIATDQRGLPRPQGSPCDIGAYEYLTITAPAPTSDTTCNGAYSCTFRGNITVSAPPIFFNGAVTGNVEQRGGNFTLFQSQVCGNVDVNGTPRSPSAPARLLAVIFKSRIFRTARTRTRFAKHSGRQFAIPEQRSHSVDRGQRSKPMHRQYGRR